VLSGYNLERGRLHPGWSSAMGWIVWTPDYRLVGRYPTKGEAIKAIRDHKRLSDNP